jgi:arginyl-tRNA synthetase
MLSVSSPEQPSVVISLCLLLESKLITLLILNFQGESFYNPYIPQVLEELSNQGLIEESKGARVIFIEGHKSPLIVVKTDGGYNYASTDLAALWLVTE